MSRTDTHRPHHVQQADPYERHRWYRFQSVSTGRPELIPIYRTCNCRVPGCSGSLRRREQRRRDRHTWRARLQREERG